MREFRFFIRCVPPKTTQQSNARIMKRKDGSQFVGKMKDSKGEKVKQSLLSLFKPHRPETPLQGPIQFLVVYTYPWRTSEPKKNRVNGYRLHDKRPDYDNMLKIPQDALSTLNFWNDDSVISDGRLIKAWGDEPGIGVYIIELGDTLPLELYFFDDLK